MNTRLVFIPSQIMARQLGTVLVLLCTCFGHANGQEQDSPEVDLFSLSLEELLQIRVTGTAVRSLGIDLIPETDNSLRRPVLAIPKSVEIIDNNTLRARGMKNVVEGAENLVGVISGESPGEPYSFAIRGFSSNSVSILFDGISAGLSTLNMRPQGTYTLDRIEIMKGPTSFHGGEGGAAGTINLITRKPKLNAPQTTETVLSYGRYDTSSLGAGMAGTMSANSAYRIDFNRTASAGWVDDTDSDSTNLVLGTLWQVSPDTELSLSFNYLRDHLPAYWGTPLVPQSVASNPLDGVIATSNGSVLDAATRYNNYNVADHLIDSDSLWTRVNLSWAASAQVQSNTTLYHFAADRNWKNAETYTFDASTGMVGRDRLLVTHDRDLWGVRSDIKIENQFAAQQNHSVFSVEYRKNNFRRKVGFDVNSPDPFVDEVDLLHPEYGLFGHVDTRREISNLTTTALVFDNVLDLTPKLFFTLTGRYESLALDRQRYDFSDLLVPRLSTDSRFNQSSYFAGLTYRVSDRITAYGHLSVQHDPIQGDLGFVFDVATFKPSTIHQAEVGLKADALDGQLEFTAAFFTSEKSIDVQREDQTKETNTQQSDGVELAMRLVVTDDFRLGGNLSYTKPEFGHYYDPNVDADVSGNTPTNAPEQTASLWTSVSPWAAYPIEAGGGINYVSARFADSSNTVILKGYSLVNFFIAYSQAQYRVALNVRNLLDEVYAPWSDVNYPGQVSLGAPRLYELSFHAKF